MTPMEGNHMQTIRPLLILIGLAFSAVTASDSYAERLGAGSSSYSGASADKVESDKRAEAEAKRRQDAADLRRAEEEAQRAELKHQALARELSCIIKPAMSDAEISQCKWAWSVPPP